jgi:hypothetical protein
MLGGDDRGHTMAGGGEPRWAQALAFIVITSVISQTLVYITLLRSIFAVVAGEAVDKARLNLWTTLGWGMGVLVAGVGSVLGGLGTYKGLICLVPAKRSAGVAVVSLTPCARGLVDGD